MKNYFAEFLGQIRGSGTQSDLAGKLGITQGSVSDFLRGEYPPSYEVLQKLVELGYNPMAMLTGNGPLKFSEELPNFPSSVVAIADKLAKHPELISPLSQMIETAEKLAQVNEQLKSELKRLKKK